MTTNLWALFVSFSKIGLISLGGGNSMLKLIESEAIDGRHWIMKEEFVRMLGSSFLFPGLTAVKLSALIGYKIAGILGLILSVLSLNLPGLLMAVIGYRYLSQSSAPWANQMMIAVQYGGLVLLLAASFSIGQSIIGLYYSLSLIILSLVFFLALVALQLSPFWGFIGFIGLCFLFT